MVNCLHPGVVRTGLYQHVSWMTVGFCHKLSRQQRSKYIGH